MNKNKIIFILSIVILLVGTILELMNYGIVAKIIIVIGALTTVFQSINYKNESVKKSKRLELELINAEKKVQENEDKVEELNDKISIIENLNLISQKHQEQIQKSKSTEEITNKFITTICEDLKASKGAFFITKENVLEFSAGYACKFKDDENSKFDIGEGLVGQAAMNKSPLNITEIPEDYIEINSGLGSAKPKNIVVFPIVLNDKVLGVFEIATFSILTEEQMTLLNIISNYIAIKITSFKN